MIRQGDAVKFKIEEIERKYLKIGDLYTERSADSVRNWKLNELETILVMSEAVTENCDNIVSRITVQQPLRRRTKPLQVDDIFDPHEVPPGFE